MVTTGAAEPTSPSGFGRGTGLGPASGQGVTQMEQEIRFDPGTEEMLLDLVTSWSRPAVEYRVARRGRRSPSGPRGCRASGRSPSSAGMDIVASVLAVVVLTPVLLAVALLIRATSSRSRSSTCRSGSDAMVRAVPDGAVPLDVPGRATRAGDEHAEQNIRRGPDPPESATTPWIYAGGHAPCGGSRSTSCRSSSTCWWAA